ncbi:Hypothetical_protein [Hexamita inflata]|uniref:Hypothetical_protein n=1 Tax=Hexamita inflata TaxID=28002 RepID=A0AA86URN0_9EUKA|nr:Hypothetical protein HINF_LOCUS56610 [Hexamita inflata]
MATGAFQNQLSAPSSILTSARFTKCHSSFKCGDRCVIYVPDSTRHAQLLSGVLAQDLNRGSYIEYLCFNAAPTQLRGALRPNGPVTRPPAVNYQEDSWPETSDRSLYNMQLLAQEHGSESQSRRAQQSLAQWPAQLAKESQSRRRLGFQLSISKTSDQDRTIMVSGLLARLCVTVYLFSPLRVTLAKSGRPTVIFKLGAPVKIQFAALRFAGRVFCLGVWPGRDCPRIRPVRAPPLATPVFAFGHLRQTAKIHISPSSRERANAARYVICWCLRRQRFLRWARCCGWTPAEMGRRSQFVLSNCGRVAKAKRRRGVAVRMSPPRLPQRCFLPSIWAASESESCANYVLNCDCFFKNVEIDIHVVYHSGMATGAFQNQLSAASSILTCWFSETIIQLFFYKRTFSLIFEKFTSCECEQYPRLNIIFRQQIEVNRYSILWHISPVN